MPLATLQTDGGPEVVVVLPRRGVDYSCCPRRVDESRPRSLKTVLELPDGLEWIRATLKYAEDRDLVQVRLLAPIPDPGRVMRLQGRDRVNIQIEALGILSNPVEQL